MFSGFFGVLSQPKDERPHDQEAQCSRSESNDSVHSVRSCLDELDVFRARLEAKVVGRSESVHSTDSMEGAPDLSCDTDGSIEWSSEFAMPLACDSDDEIELGSYLNDLARQLSCNVQQCRKAVSSEGDGYLLSSRYFSFLPNLELAQLGTPMQSPLEPWRKGHAALWETEAFYHDRLPPKVKIPVDEILELRHHASKYDGRQVSIKYSCEVREEEIDVCIILSEGIDGESWCRNMREFLARLREDNMYIW
mmetsp:Transcript_59208/g.93933  ORF Transcript_59208/g.93933 Transcript_59208/m.93933 type:complete len:251 (+) Transcript_59208:46-798(+)